MCESSCLNPWWTTRRLSNSHYKQAKRGAKNCFWHVLEQSAQHTFVYDFLYIQKFTILQGLHNLQTAYTCWANQLSFNDKPTFFQGLSWNKTIPIIETSKACDKPWNVLKQISPRKHVLQHVLGDRHVFVQRLTTTQALCSKLSTLAAPFSKQYSFRSHSDWPDAQTVPTTWASFALHCDIIAHRYRARSTLCLLQEHTNSRGYRPRTH